MQRSRWHNLGFFALALLWACSGSVGGGAVEGGGPGGPVGGNFAAGPVSLPAPTVVSPNNPVEWLYISCKNIVGSTFECGGNVHSVAANSEILFSIYLPAAAVPRDTFTTTAAADGSWRVSHNGSAGEFVEICPKVNGVCKDVRVFKLPPEGGTVEGAQGTMKNLVIDPQGTSWHSRWLPSRLSLGRLFASLWISDAKAQTGIPYTPVSCDPGMISLEVVPDADAPACFLYKAGRGDVASARVLNFENCEQTDIHDIVSTQIPVVNTPVLLVAVKNRVYVVETQGTPRITYFYSYPTEVTKIMDQGGGRFVVAGKTAPDASAATPPRNIYFLDLAKKGPLAAGCYTSNETLRGLNGVTSSDSYKDAFAMVAYLASGQYQVFLGRTQPGSLTFRNSPLPLTPPSANPLEVKVLDVDSEYAYVAVLYAAEKKIALIKHYQPATDVLSLDAPVDQVLEIALEGLTVTGNPLSLSRPQLLNANRDTHELVFVDIGEAGSKLVTVPYAYASGAWTPATTASSLSLGAAGPVFLCRDTAAGAEGGWTYNDANYRFQRVRTQRELTPPISATVDALRNEGTLLYFYVPPTTSNEEGEE